MTIKRSDMIFVVAVGLVVLGVSLLPSPRDQNPRLPGDEAHRSVTRESECQRCHAAGGSRPLSIPPHPKRVDCLRCHARA